MTNKSKLYEGFWDSLITKAKRGALATASSFGNKTAEGKLTALNLSTGMYDAYKFWTSSKGMPNTKESMQEFLQAYLGYSDQFSANVSNKFGKIVGGTVDASSDKRVEPTVGSEAEKPKGAPEEAPKEADKKEPEAAQEPKEDDAHDRSDAVDEFKLSSEFALFRKVYGNTAFSQAISGGDYQYSEDQDGSVLFVPDAGVSQLKGLLAKSLKTQESKQKAASALVKAGILTTWPKVLDSLKASGFEVDSRNGNTQVELVKDALMAASKKVGKNFSLDLNRFILATPSEPGSGVRFNLKESVLTTDITDWELRKFFLNVAKLAFKTGEAKIAAKEEISTLRSRKDVEKEQNSYTSTMAGDDATTNSDSVGGQSSQQTQSRATQRTTAPSSIGLSKADMAILNDYEGSDIIDSITSDIPDIQDLARKLLAGAITDYKKKNKK